MVVYGLVDVDLEGWQLMSTYNYVVFANGGQCDRELVFGVLVVVVQEYLAQFEHVGVVFGQVLLVVVLNIFINLYICQ
jgi:hypothetical protein